MRTFSNILIFVALIFLCSCGSTPSLYGASDFKTPSGVKSSDKLSDLTLEQRTELNTDLNGVLQSCLSNLDVLQNKSEKQTQNTDLWLVAAIIASGIVSPALLLANAHANAVTVVAANGFSATATYIAKNNESTNQSGAYIATNHDALVAEVQSDMDSLTEPGKTAGDVENMMLKVSDECTLIKMGVPTYAPVPVTNQPAVKH